MPARISENVRVKSYQPALSSDARAAAAETGFLRGESGDFNAAGESDPRRKLHNSIYGSLASGDQQPTPPGLSERREEERCCESCE